jgi:hypothetical protein
MSTSYYRVYRAEYLGVPRNHHAIFVETHENGNGTGHQYHVTGNVQSGMTYEQTGSEPRGVTDFLSMEYLGWVSTTDYYRIGELVSQNRPPKKQFNGPKRLYPSEPLRRCQEWTEESIDILWSESVLQTGDPPSNEYWTWSEEQERYFHQNEDGTVDWAKQA